MKKILLLIALVLFTIPTFAANLPPVFPGGTNGQFQYNNNGAFAGWGGPIAPIPTVTPTANTNLLSYTGELASEWNINQQAIATTGQPDENGANTASVFAANTGTYVHNIIWYLSHNVFAASSTPTNYTIYAKPNGYNYVDFGFLDNTTYFDNWFNISTCTVVSFGTNVTATATAAGNGYCQLTLQFQAGGGTYLNQVYAESAPSASVTYAGNGTSGAYFSHPQLTLTSGAQTYQDVTGNHHYCVAAYNIFGQTGGCSPWVGSNAENNSITIPTVSGASYYKLFRTGGYTTGALIVSGSTQLTAGQVVTDYQLTTDGTAAPVQNPVATSAATIADTRTSGVQQQSYGYLQGHSSIRILTAEPGLPGTIQYIHLSTNNTDTENEQIVFSCSGQSPQTVDLGSFFMLQDYPAAPFSNSRIGLTGTVKNGFSAQRQVEIPFTSGCNVDMFNNTSGLVFFFSDAIYKAGQYYSSPLRHVWHAQLNTLTTTPAAADATVNLLPTVTNSSGLELESIMQYVTPVSVTTCYGYLEGNPTVYTDGFMATTANGTEDFYLSGWYFNTALDTAWVSTTTYAAQSTASYNGVNWVSLQASNTGNTPQIGSAYWAPNPASTLQSNRAGNFIGSALNFKTAAADSVLYRFFGEPEVGDNVTAANSLQVTWQNGQYSEGSCNTTSNWKSLVTYWTGS